MYIAKQFRKYWAYHDVPPSLRKTIGRRRFSANLETDDRATAEIRAALKKAQWLAVIERAKTGTDLEQEAIFYRAALKEAVSPNERERIMDFLTDRAMDKAQEIDGVPHHYAEPGENAEERPGYQAGLRLLKIATGELVKLTENLDEYLATLKSKNEGKSVDMKKSTINKFAVKFPYVADVQRKAVQEWVNVQAANGSAPATIRRSLSELRGYWVYLQSISAASDDANPFEKLSLPKAGKNAKADERRPFAPDDVLKLLAAAHDDAPLADLITLAMWTGARIEELCALKVKKVHLEDGYIDIAYAKTSAGWRQVPIHSKLAPTLQRLIEASSDGYILSGLSPNKYGDRSNAIGKRFGHLKAAEGFGPQYVFHSIRKTVATLLENAAVSEGVAADILGHEKQTITYGLYSGGTSLEKKQVAIETLSYNEEKSERHQAKPIRKR